MNKKEKCKCGKGKIYTYRNVTLKRNIESCKGCGKIFYNKSLDEFEK